MFAPTANNSATEPLSRSSSSKYRTSRRQSLRIHQALNIPIPPTLLQSPHLNSPQSIFKRTVSAPRHPNAEDEQWLQDTVPLSLDGGEDHGQRARSSRSSQISNASRGERGQSQDAQLLAHNAPPSPPLVRWRGTPTPAPPTWLSQAKSHSAPCLSDQGYFIDAA